ncbi:2Fe-2S iron-sulfur cluster binding domain-containing protein [Xanthobacter autotrophicus]|uniref:2Fe-2S iron-sulfur cluster binding domain-containing protein n=1 Tax=Xanthobacter autotrophicus TaxID=280 RepID=UPI00372D87BD
MGPAALRHLHRSLFLRGGSAPALEAVRHHHRRHRAILWMAPAPGSILDAALTAGGALRSGCRVGQCESCIVEVHEVQFAHRVPFEGAPDRAAPARLCRLPI